VPLLVNTLPDVLGAGGVTVSVPDVVIGPPVTVNPYKPVAATLVTVAELVELIVTVPTPVAGLIVMLVPAMILLTAPPSTTELAIVAVAAFPVMLIGQVPVALEPSTLAAAHKLSCVQISTSAAVFNTNLYLAALNHTDASPRESRMIGLVLAVKPVMLV
jgi:hypothetical protein